MPISIYTRGQPGEVAAVFEWSPDRAEGWCHYCSKPIAIGASVASVREFDAEQGDTGLWLVALNYGGGTVFHAGCADTAAAMINAHGGPDGPLTR